MVDEYLGSPFYGDYYHAYYADKWPKVEDLRHQETPHSHFVLDISAHFDWPKWVDEDAGYTLENERWMEDTTLETIRNSVSEVW